MTWILDTWTTNEACISTLFHADAADACFSKRISAFRVQKHAKATSWCTCRAPAEHCALGLLGLTEPEELLMCRFNSELLIHCLAAILDAQDLQKERRVVFADTVLDPLPYLRLTFHNLGSRTWLAKKHCVHSLPCRNLDLMVSSLRRSAVHFSSALWPFWGFRSVSQLGKWLL